MAKCWDVVVIGAGAAGLSAARAVGAAGRSCLCIDRLGPGGELINLGPLHDCPDLAPETTGADLVAELTDAATGANVELAVGEVRALRRTDNWLIVTDEETHEARAVILATGLTQGALGVPGEDRFEGVGLSHCAACDGPLCAGDNVVVAGTDKWALQDAIDLAGMAAHVTLVRPDDAAWPADGRTAQLAKLANVTVIAGRVIGLEGAQGLDAVVVERDGTSERLPARTVFVQSNRRAALDFVGGLIDADTQGRAVVDGDLRTSDPRAYAAGDVRAGAAERVSVAIADGRRAGAAVIRLLDGSGVDEPASTRGGQRKEAE